MKGIDTALCIAKLSNINSDDIPLPSNVYSSVPTALAFDNIDSRDGVLIGAGTSHRINGLIVQPTSLTCTTKINSNCNEEKRATNNPAN